jgi:hypothetical protein
MNKFTLIGYTLLLHPIALHLRNWEFAFLKLARGDFLFTGKLLKSARIAKLNVMGRTLVKESVTVQNGSNTFHIDVNSLSRSLFVKVNVGFIWTCA